MKRASCRGLQEKRWSHCNTRKEKRSTARIKRGEKSVGVRS